MVGAMYLTASMDNETIKALYRRKLNAFAPRALMEIEPSVNYVHNWHVDCVSEHLEAVWKKDIKRIIINIPPRTLKTHLSSVSFPTWGFIQDPTVKFMLTSFKFERAEAMTRKSRQIMSSSWYQDLTDVRISNDLNRAHFFQTTGMGQYYASAMATVTGEGADIVIVDDPLHPDEAASPKQRQNCIDTIKGTLFSRFNDEKTGRFILIMQRLNEDDPTGELLKEEGWYHLKLPAEAIGKSYSYTIGDQTWQFKEGELLFPARLSREILDQKAVDMGAYNYAGQMLQEPKPVGGGEIKSEFLNYYVSESLDVTQSNMYIIVDPAKGDEDAIKNDNDYTAMVVWALAPDQNYYVVDGIRERLNPTERIDKLFELHRKWTKKSGTPPRVGYEDIGMQADMHYINTKMATDNYRFPITPLPPKGKKRLSKILKIRRLVPLFEKRQIWLPNDIWYKDYKGLPRNFISDIVEQEFLLFPFAPHDDFLDAMSMLLDMDAIFPKMGEVDIMSDVYGDGYEQISVLDI